MSRPEQVLADDDLAALLALASNPWLGPSALMRSLHEGPRKVWTAVASGHPERSPALATLKTSKVAAEARGVDPEEVLARHRSAGIEMVVFGEPGYPARLIADPAPPVVLFATTPMSELLSPHRPAAAIVGTRNATRVGRTFASDLGRDLAAAGVVVVSGLALGIDGAAHRGALEAGATENGSRPGSVLGVVASGLDITYPRRHADLHRDVARHGVLISETPLGCRPTAWRFPARNRIIAALSDVVVVVESRAKGGSMLTADEAGDRGIAVMAVPGHPTAPAAAGTNSLIASGVQLATGSRDVLDNLGVRQPTTQGADRPRSAVDRPLDVRQREVLEAIGDQPAALDEIVVRARLTVEETADVLTQLEVIGLVSCSAGWYEPSSTGGERS